MNNLAKFINQYSLKDIYPKLLRDYGNKKDDDELVPQMDYPNAVAFKNIIHEKFTESMRVDLLNILKDECNNPNNESHSDLLFLKKFFELINPIYTANEFFIRRDTKSIFYSINNKVGLSELSINTKNALKKYSCIENHTAQLLTPLSEIPSSTAEQKEACPGKSLIIRTWVPKKELKICGNNVGGHSAIRVYRNNGDYIDVNLYQEDNAAYDHTLKGDLLRKVGIPTTDNRPGLFANFDHAPRYEATLIETVIECNGTDLNFEGCYERARQLRSKTEYNAYTDNCAQQVIEILKAGDAENYTSTDANCMGVPIPTETLRVAERLKLATDNHIMSAPKSSANKIKKYEAFLNKCIFNLKSIYQSSENKNLIDTLVKKLYSIKACEENYDALHKGIYLTAHNLISSAKDLDDITTIANILMEFYSDIKGENEAIIQNINGKIFNNRGLLEREDQEEITLSKIKESDGNLHIKLNHINSLIKKFAKQTEFTNILKNERQELHQEIYFKTNQSIPNSNSLVTKLAQLTDFDTASLVQNTSLTLQSVIEKYRETLYLPQNSLDQLEKSYQNKAIKEASNKKSISDMPSIFNIFRWGKRNQYLELQTRVEIHEILVDTNTTVHRKINEINRVIDANQPFWHFGKRYERYQLLKNKTKIVCAFDAFVNGEISHTQLVTYLDRNKSRASADIANHLDVIIKNINNSSSSDSYDKMSSQLGAVNPNTQQEEPEPPVFSTVTNVSNPQIPNAGDNNDDNNSHTQFNL